MSPVRLLIADDHEIVRRGLRTVLEARPGWSVVGEASNGREAVEKAKQVRPDVVIMDISMPLMNGLEATRQIIESFPEMKILVLSVHDSDSLIQSILKVRASGYLLKSDATRDLVTAKGHGHYRVDHIRMTAGQLLNQFLTEAKRILE